MQDKLLKIIFHKSQISKINTIRLLLQAVNIINHLEFKDKVVMGLLEISSNLKLHQISLMTRISILKVHQGKNMKMNFTNGFVQR